MKTELVLKFTFEASHSLSDYEVPHPHLWRLEVGVTGTPVDGRIIDIVLLRESVQKQLDFLSLTYLNTNPRVGDSVRQFPTCETLSQYFWDELQGMLKASFSEKNPSVRLSYIVVAICNMDGAEMGGVRITPST